MEVRLQRSNLTAVQITFKKAMDGMRITVKWILEEVKIYFSAID